MQNITDISPDAEHEDDMLMQALAELPLRTPAPEFAENFRRRLAAERPRRRSLPPFLITGVAAMLVIAAGAGWWHERQLRLNETSQLHSQLTTAMQSLSAATRLTAINATVTQGQHGDAVEQALIAALLTDQSTNVRMAAAEALGRIARPEVLGKAVRQALAAENSAFVQMSLLDATHRLSSSERLAAIAPILVRDHIDPMVINDARSRSLEQTKEDSR